MNKNIPLIFTILTIFGNYYIPKLNNQSVGFVAGENQLDAQPSGWTFSIWGFIYTALIYLTYKISQNKIVWSDGSIALYVLTCAFNLIWIYTWTKNKPDISQYMLIGLVLSLFLLWNNNINISNKRVYQNILSVYLAWTLGASLLNIFIVKDNTVNGSKNVLYLVSAVQILWQIIYYNKSEYLNDSLLLPLTGVWTGLGIALNDSNNLGITKYFPLIISIGSTINHYNRIGTPDIPKLLFE